MSVKTRPRFYLALLVLQLTSFGFADEVIQSRFWGPVEFTTWQHWQPSWNAKHNPQFPHEFEFVRGFIDGRSPFSCLKFISTAPDSLTAKIKGKAIFTTGPFLDIEKEIPEIAVLGSFANGEHTFKIPDSSFLDITGKQIVTKIEFEIFKDGRPIYHYTVLPMFARGSRNYHWGTKINSYTAHAGTGDLFVANGLDAIKDKWNGVPVRPVIEFQDFNRHALGQVVGLHSHEANIEGYVVVNGEIIVTHGIAPKDGGLFFAEELWETEEGKGPIVRRNVPHQLHRGGFLEERELTVGEYAYIVPNPSDSLSICVHGLLATTNATTFTLGKKN